MVISAKFIFAAFSASVRLVLLVFKTQTLPITSPAQIIGNAHKASFSRPSTGKNFSVGVLKEE